MKILDEDGRIFGLINIIDALVILLVLAVAVAGFALVTAEDTTTTTTTTTYATLDLGQQPAYLLSEIDEGDEGSIANMTITDVWVTPQRFNGGNGLSVTPKTDGFHLREQKTGPHVFARVRIEATQTDDQLMVNDEPLTLGRGFELSADEYVVRGTTIATGNNSSISTTQTELTVSATVPAGTASKLSRGDTIKTIDRPVGTVKSVSVSQSSSTNMDSDRRVTVDVSVSTAEYGATRFYGGQVIQTGVSVPIQTDKYRFIGRVETVSANES
jgi:hypothetical protein